MKRQYYALKASLPMLLFDAAPVMDSAAFLSHCAAFLAPDRLKFLRELTLSPRALPVFDAGSAVPPSGQRKTGGDAAAMEKYAAWEICLRNTLARLRAAKLGRDPEANTVKFAEYDPAAAAAAHRVFDMNANPLDKEKALDRARWDFLSAMEWNHAFNFEALCLYRCKLLILEKWSARRAGDAEKNFEEAVARSEKTAVQSGKVSAPANRRPPGRE